MKEIINLTEMILNNVCESCIAFFKKYNENSKENIKWFIGGSYRFRYHNESSDLDFFVFWSENNEEIEFPFYLIMNGFHSMNPEDMVEYPGGTRGYKHERYDIHVIVFDSYTRWNVLKCNHESIERYLNSNPEVLKFITKMKNQFNETFSFKGKWFYRTLVEILK